MAKVKFKINHSFNGASSKKAYNCEAGKVYDIPDADLTHLDKQDYEKEPVKDKPAKDK